MVKETAGKIKTGADYVLSPLRQDCSGAVAVYYIGYDAVYRNTGLVGCAVKKVTVSYAKGISICFLVNIAFGTIESYFAVIEYASRLDLYVEAAYN